MIYKGTTPDFIFDLGEFDPTTAEKVVVTFSTTGSRVLFEKWGSEIEMDHSSVSVYLNQEEMLALPQKVKVQINFLFSEGVRFATDIVNVQLDNNLHNEVIENG